MISCVVPCWNYGKFLGECLRSIRNQSVQFEHVLVVDDCSSDSTAEVAAAFVAKHPNRFRYERHPERTGVVKLMNRWLPTLPSEWVCAVSADDWLSPHFVREHVRAIHCHRADPRFSLVYCSAEYVVTDPAATRPDLHGARVRAIAWDAAELEQRNYIHGAAVVRRSAGDDCGWFADTVPEDWDLWRRMARSGLVGAPIDQVLYYYRQHADGHRNYGEDWKRA